ncbi:uncharacterized, partial [Tachysurus ichikawai]
GADGVADGGADGGAQKIHTTRAGEDRQI